MQGIPAAAPVPGDRPRTAALAQTVSWITGKAIEEMEARRARPLDQLPETRVGRVPHDRAAVPLLAAADARGGRLGSGTHHSDLK